MRIKLSFFWPESQNKIYMNIFNYKLIVRLLAP
jgi:hypothetical protein